MLNRRLKGGIDESGMAEHGVEHYRLEVLPRYPLPLVKLEHLSVFEQFTIRCQIIAMQLPPTVLFRAFEEIAEFLLRRMEVRVRLKAKAEYGVFCCHVKARRIYSVNESYRNAGPRSRGADCNHGNPDANPWGKESGRHSGPEFRLVFPDLILLQLVSEHPLADPKLCRSPCLYSAGLLESLDDQAAFHGVERLVQRAF